MNTPSPKKNIAVAALGDPRSPKTWTHAPVSIINELEAQGYSVSSIDASIKNKFAKISFFLSYQLSRLRLYGFTPRSIARQIRLVYAEYLHDYQRTRKTRDYCAKIVCDAIQETKSTQVLHMGGTLLLPHSDQCTPSRRYTYLDATWHTTSRYHPTEQRCTPEALALFEKLERESFAQIEHFFSFSEYVKADLINHYQIAPERITVVGCGTGKIKPYYGPKNYADGHILFTAKLRFFEKGGKLLLDAFRIAQKKKPDLKLVIVGQDSYKEMVKDIPNVTVYGYIEWDKLQQLYYDASLFAMPAIMEPWGQVYVEALECKTPILGLNRNSLPEITQNGRFGFLVDEAVPEQVADAILDAYSDPVRLQQMAEEGQKYCLDNFSWHQVATKIAEGLSRSPQDSSLIQHTNK